MLSLAVEVTTSLDFAALSPTPFFSDPHLKIIWRRIVNIIWRSRDELALSQSDAQKGSLPS